ncbi:MAG: DUF3604 domain-containing protein [Pseudomonadales bacterium]
MNTKRAIALPGLLLLLLGACDRDQTETATTVPVTPAGTSEAVAATGTCSNHDELGMALYGDLHVHTSYSFDAAANATGADPYAANRYAQGEEIPFFPIDSSGKAIGTAQIDRPLDFLAVTDHGEFLGERAICRTESSLAYDTAFCQRYRSDQRVGMSMLGAVITTETPERITEICGEDGSQCLAYAASPWEKIQDAANTANRPCEFTSFIGYEYTGTPGTSNYHRNVIFRGSQVPKLPVSYVDAPIDSKLWSGLDGVCLASEGCDYLTIPHNSNLANGRMAPYMQLEKTVEARRGYAEARLKREPIMEIFQHKGGSECVNGLSSVLSAPDELCDVEAVRPLGGTKTYAARNPDGSLVIDGVTEDIRECAPDETSNNGMLGGGCVHPTDFQRSALAVGLREEQEIGLNPIKLGVIASTDTHAATPGNVQESGWTGAVTGEATPAERLQPGVLTSGIDGNPGGLAAVWAKENTRDAIFDAMLRREVFGTSGPRISLRFFAGWSLDGGLCGQPDMIAKAYTQGVPMGGDLEGEGTKPRFLAAASKDPAGNDLSELQLVKGWVDADGALRTEVVPIAQEAEGAASLCTVYTDEGFDPALPSYYYLKAVEPETPRWHTYDCAKVPEAERPAVCSDGSHPQTIREMAWSSPVWYRPQTEEI